MDSSHRHQLPGAAGDSLQERDGPVLTWTFGETIKQDPTRGNNLLNKSETAIYFPISRSDVQSEAMSMLRFCSMFNLDQQSQCQEWNYISSSFQHCCCHDCQETLRRAPGLTGSHHCTLWWSLRSEYSPLHRVGMSVSTRWGSGPGQDSPQHFPADRADQTGLHSGSTSSNCCPSTERNQTITSSEVVLIKFYFDGHEIVFLLHVLDPLGCLTLRINHECPPPGIGHNDAIVNGEVVLW